GPRERALFAAANKNQRARALGPERNGVPSRLCGSRTTDQRARTIARATLAAGRKISVVSGMDRARRIGMSYRNRSDSLDPGPAYVSSRSLIFCLGSIGK